MKKQKLENQSAAYRVLRNIGGRTLALAMALTLGGAMATATAANTDSLPGLAAQPVEYFFTGKPYDADSESYTFKYRNYDPELNRWTSADQLGFLDGINCYIYTPTPTSSFDYMGLFDAATFGQGLGEFSSGILMSTGGIALLTVASPTIAGAAGGIVLVTAGITSFGAGATHMIEAFNDTNTWVPTSVQGTTLAALAASDGQLTEQETQLIDAFEYLTGQFGNDPAAAQMLLDLHSAIESIDSIQGSLNSTRDFIEAQNPDTDEPGYE